MEVGGNTTVHYKKGNKSHVETWNNRPGSGWKKITHTQYWNSGSGVQTNYYSSGSGWSDWKTVIKSPIPKRNLFVSATVSPKDKALNAARRGYEPNAFERSGAWIHDNWDSISMVGTVVGTAACIALSFGACVAVGAGVVAGKEILDGYQYWFGGGRGVEGREFKWGEHVAGAAGVGLSGAFSSWLGGAMRYGSKNGVMGTRFSFSRVWNQRKDTVVRRYGNGSIDFKSTAYDVMANTASVAGGNYISGLGSRGDQ